MELKSAVLILLFFAAVIAVTIWLAWIFLRKRARTVGHDSVLVYLRAIPDSDVQKLDAVDLALKGGLITILGIIFPPLIIIGLVPLYYGLRKITMTLMGLGLTESVPA